MKKLSYIYKGKYLYLALRMGFRTLTLSVFILFCSCASVSRAQNTPPPELLSTVGTGALWVKYELNPNMEDSLRKHSGKDKRYNYQRMALKASKASKKRSAAEYLSYVSLNRNDTIDVVILPKAPVNMGFRIMIVKDSCAAFFFAYENEPVTGAFK